jgi:hypothetical protein
MIIGQKSKMQYTTYTFKCSEIPTDVARDIENLLTSVVDLKKDKYWKNYENFDFQNQVAVSTQYNENGRLELFSTVHTRSFYPPNTYRLLTRFLRTPDGRLGGAKTNEGDQPSYVMLNQQVELVKELGADFYFMSRQRVQMRWINYYLNGFNERYNHNFIVSDKQYRVTDSKNPENSLQTIIYPNHQTIPFATV